MAMAFLPAEKIPEEYERQKKELSQAHTNKLKNFLAYFERYWMKIVKPEGFSIYRLSRRSNNCIEGFHSTLKNALGLSPMPCDFLRKLTHFDYLVLKDMYV